MKIPARSIVKRQLLFLLTLFSRRTLCSLHKPWDYLTNFAPKTFLSMAKCKSPGSLFYFHLEGWRVGVYGCEGYTCQAGKNETTLPAMSASPSWQKGYGDNQGSAVLFGVHHAHAHRLLPPTLKKKKKKTKRLSHY